MVTQTKYVDSPFACADGNLLCSDHAFTVLREAPLTGHYGQGVHRYQCEEGGEKALRGASLYHLHFTAGGFPETEYDPQAYHGHRAAAV